MLTPYFELSQTESELHLLIRAPLSNISSTELCTSGDLLVFYSSPYYLRLHLPGNVVEKEGDTGDYDSGKQEFRFVLQKVTPGEHFEDLDMIGKLLEPQKKYQIKPEISICSDSEVVPSSDPESDDEFLGYISQEIMPDTSNVIEKFGFANKGHVIGENLRFEFREILEFGNYENIKSEDRSLLREAYEMSKFSEDHYLADLMEPEEIHELILWNHCDRDGVDTFTQEEKEQLKSFGNRDYLLDHTEKKIALLSLVDILFAYAYDQRTTMGDESVESPWTINKLSATLSWLQTFHSMKEVKIASGRRSLIFPLYRNWELTEAVFIDTSAILKQGRRKIIKCLLHIHRMFNMSEPRYLLNQLYITDYCIWLQKASDKMIKKISDLFDQTTISKGDLRLELEELEEAAALVSINDELEITQRLMGLTLDGSSSETESSSDSESSSSDSDTSMQPDSDTSSQSDSDTSSIDSDDFSSDDDFSERESSSGSESSICWDSYCSSQWDSDTSSQSDSDTSSFDSDEPKIEVKFSMKLSYCVE